MNEMARRILIAAVGAPVLVGLTWLGGDFFIAAMVLILIQLQRELIRLMDHQGFRPNPTLVYLSGGLILATVYFPEFTATALIAVILIQIGVETINPWNRQMYRLMSSMFCTFYPVLGILSLILLREAGAGPQSGFALVLLLYFMIWGNDTFAFFGGRTFGTHLMAPHISPKKTWEGYAFGIFGAAAGLWLSVTLFPVTGAGIATLWPLIPIISVFGPLGDLAASKIKRAANVKDASNLLPGHGGFLDRFDSLILAAPALYLYALWFLI